MRRLDHSDWNYEWINTEPFNSLTRDLDDEAAKEFVDVIMRVYLQIKRPSDIPFYGLDLGEVASRGWPLFFDDQNPGSVLDPVTGFQLKYPLEFTLAKIKKAIKGGYLEIKNGREIRRMEIGDYLKARQLEWLVEQGKKISEMKEEIKAYWRKGRGGPEDFIIKEVETQIGEVFNVSWDCQEIISARGNLIASFQGEEFIIFDCSNINEPRRSPMFFCSANNYGFLVCCIGRFMRFVSIYEEPQLDQPLHDLRLRLSKGDLYHFPSMRGDYILPYEAALGTFKRRPEVGYLTSTFIKSKTGRFEKEALLRWGRIFQEHPKVPLSVLLRGLLFFIGMINTTFKIPTPPLPISFFEYHPLIEHGKINEALFDLIYKNGLYELPEPDKLLYEAINGLEGYDDNSNEKMNVQEIDPE